MEVHHHLGVSLRKKKLWWSAVLDFTISTTPAAVCPVVIAGVSTARE